MADTEWTPDFYVLKNQYQCDKYDHTYHCDVCQQMASVVSMGNIWLCKNCLVKGIEALDKALVNGDRREGN